MGMGSSARTEEGLFEVGDQVEKVVGDYQFRGVGVAAFAKLGGQVRYVVENQDGILHIFSSKQLSKKGQDENYS